MRTYFLMSILALGAAGCGTVSKNDSNAVTNGNQPGPLAGRYVGAGAGLVVGNAAGAVVGVGEGVAAGVAAPFSPPPPTSVVDYRTVTGPDGKLVRVPVQTPVDPYGRPLAYPVTQSDTRQPLATTNAATLGSPSK